MIEIALYSDQNWAPRFYKSFSVQGNMLVAVTPDGDAYTFILDNVDFVRLVSVQEYEAEKKKGV